MVVLGITLQSVGRVKIVRRNFLERNKRMVWMAKFWTVGRFAG